MLHEIFAAIEETVFMVLTSGGLSISIGLLLGLGLMQLSTHQNTSTQKILYRICSNVFESLAHLPYLAFVILLVPASRKLLGSDTGIIAALFSLTIIAVFPFATLCEKTLIAKQKHYQDLAISLSATPWQSISKLYLKQAFPELLRGFSQILVQLLGYSVLAGVFGAGGLGGLLITKGYQNFEWSYVLASIFILMLMTQGIKYSTQRFIPES